MAIFGVHGKVETQARRHLDFQIRYIIDFGAQPRYGLYAAVMAPAGESDSGDQVKVIQSDEPQ